MTRQIPPPNVSSPPAAPQPRGSISGSLQDVDVAEAAAAGNAVPSRNEGVVLLGAYEGGGYDEPRYLVSRGDGQMVLVSAMLNAVIGAVTGDRTLEQVAEHAGRDYGEALSPEAVRYLIDRKLEPLGLVIFGEPVAAPPRANPLLALSLHRILLPAKVVRRLAAIFAPLFNPGIIIAVALALLTLDVWLVATGHLDAALHRAVGSPALMLAVVGITLVNTLFHECGHAAGCHYGGGRPGPIGVGVLIVVPAFYTNVNDAYRLDRRGRLRTDLGGIYFNSVFAVAIGAIYLLTGFAAIPAIIVLIHLQMLQQLLPLIRLDGYYILGDLVGVPNLFEQIPKILRHAILRREPARSITSLRPRARLTITVWVAVVVPALLAALVNMAFYLPRYLGTAIANMVQYWDICVLAVGRGDAGIVAVALISILVLLVPWVGVTSLLVRTVMKIVSAVRRRRDRRRGADARRRERELAAYRAR